MSLDLRGGRHLFEKKINTWLNPLTHLHAFPLPAAICTAQKSPSLASLVGQPHSKPLFSTTAVLHTEERLRRSKKTQKKRQV